ncbi:DUF4267 domain-containing protein [Actinomycetospora sp. CA-101289]|uniref:DUF4267 domain-containing protein n=1 Tax=Actinomycetospora sp. CA-101289 TaxID=3239893 RepID=UPI003D96F900
MTTQEKIATGVAWLTGLGIAAIGTRFLLQPEASAAGYGAAAPTSGDPYLAVKGVRDIGSGLILLSLLSTGQHRAVGATLLAASVIPAGDAAIVLAHGGPAATAYGVHGGTAAAMVAAAAVILRRTRPAAFARAALT